MILALIACSPDCHDPAPSDRDRCYAGALAAGDIAQAIELGTFSDDEVVRRNVRKLRKRFGPVDVCLADAPGATVVADLQPLDAPTTALEALALAYATAELATMTCFSGALPVGTYAADPPLVVRHYVSVPRLDGACAAARTRLESGSVTDAIAAIPASLRRDPAEAACLGWLGAPQELLAIFPYNLAQPGVDARRAVADDVGFGSVAAVWRLVEGGVLDERDDDVRDALVRGFQAVDYPEAAAAFRAAAIERDPGPRVNPGDVRVDEAWRALERGDSGAARTALSDAHRLSPTWLPAGDLLDAVLIFREGRYADVLAALAVFEARYPPMLAAVEAAAAPDEVEPVPISPGVAALEEWRAHRTALEADEDWGSERSDDALGSLVDQVEVPREWPADLRRRLHDRWAARLREIEREESEGRSYRKVLRACARLGIRGCTRFEGEALLSADFDGLAVTLHQRRAAAVSLVLRHERRRLEWAVEQSERLKFAAAAAQASPELAPERLRLFDARHGAQARAQTDDARLAAIAVIEPLLLRLNEDPSPEARASLVDLQGEGKRLLAEHHVSRGEYPEARAAYAAVGGTGRARALFNAALCSLKVGEPSVALATLDAALGEPGVPADVRERALLWAAVLYAGTGREAEGRSWFAARGVAYEETFEQARVELLVDR